MVKVNKIGCSCVARLSALDDAMPWPGQETARAGWLADDLLRPRRLHWVNSGIAFPAADAFLWYAFDIRPTKFQGHA